ncbi:MAG: glucose-6-phosphate isomerase [Planctomycetaceae bacterium]|nr:glucose-6-phosphate isomerase [Planctomycetaceae bacterium]MCB9952940.1 glucose-6-phosphate isomerase [Planctomycetaceae bacterium]
MSSAISYNAAATNSLIQNSAREQLAPSLLAARDEIFADLDLLSSGNIPAEKQPLDSGCIDLPQRLLTSESALVDRMEAAAAKFAGQVDRMLVLGIGGSYMGLRALFEALCDPCHNDLPRELRGNAPRLSFEGDNLDNDAQQALLRLLSLYKNPQELAERWGIVVISKSGGTLETAAAFRVYRKALEAYYGASSAEATELVIPVTGETGRLRDLSNTRGYQTTFPIPDGVGGRFSVFTAVGLLPAAVLGIDIRQLLQGAADITEALKTGEPGSNPVLDYVSTCHLLERDHGMDIRVLSVWGKRMEAIGLWYDQLLAESLGKHEKGATPLTVVNTRDLHSRGQQHQEGKRDRVITNVTVGSPSTADIHLPSVDASLDQDQLNRIAGKSVHELLAAAIQGTNEAYASDNRPTADIHLPKLDAYAVGQLLQMFMLATVLEGRLIGINPYGQPGVEGYKGNMGRILYGK